MERIKPTSEGTSDDNNMSSSLTRPIDRVEEDRAYFEVYERFRFDGDATFTDIDGTLTDNTGEFDDRALEAIHRYQENGGMFIPVTGRARFESVRDIVEKTGAPYAVINNGAEIYDRDGNMIFGSEIPDDQVRKTYEIASECGLIWMQNKKDPKTGKEHLYSNFTEESEHEMMRIGIRDTVHNEEGRIGLSAVHATPEEVMAIPGQNYKIQMMSPYSAAVKYAYNKLTDAGIPCMLNMQSGKTNQYHWVEVIKGTKIDGIQWLIDSGMIGDIKTAKVVGDGGNDLTMFKELHDREGNPITNTKIAVRNACEKLKEAADTILESEYDHARRDIGKGGAMVEVFEEELRLREVKAFIDIARQLLEKRSSNEDELLEWVQSYKNRKRGEKTIVA